MTAISAIGLKLKNRPRNSKGLRRVKVERLRRLPVLPADVSARYRRYDLLHRSRNRLAAELLSAPALRREPAIPGQVRSNRLGTPLCRSCKCRRWCQVDVVAEEVVLFRT